ncbi:aurora borealis [Carabus blaptoides fortunei]
MENHQTPSKTSAKFLENLPKDLREAVSRKSQIHASPFRCLPLHTTPPSRFLRIKNPFEAALNEHLHSHIFSPSVFADVQNPRTSEKFMWTIDDVSSLKPAHIDESTIAQFEQPNCEDDVSVQAKIEKYFSETHIAPSPWNQEVKQLPLLPESTSPAVIKEESPEPKEVANVWTQTVLTLPPNLPEDIEKILKPFFSFTGDQHRQSVDLNSSLCRRLFHFESPELLADSSASSIRTEWSDVGSPIIAEETDKRKRNFDSSPGPDLIPVEISPIHNSTPRKLNDCPISPISMSDDIQFRADADNPDTDQLISPISLCKKTRNRSFAKLDFSGHMSVDTSFNMAPENDLIDVQNQTNLSESPARTNEFTASFCNWDVEYNNISLNGRPIRRNLFELKSHAVECMDISNITTPKSKIINSQRKNLSNSFKLSESLSEDELLHVVTEETKLRRNLTAKFDTDSSKGDSHVITQDTGYQTGSELSHKLAQTDIDVAMCDISSNLSANVEQDDWNPNIFASTPSKRYFYDIRK